MLLCPREGVLSTLLQTNSDTRARCERYQPNVRILHYLTHDPSRPWGCDFVSPSHNAREDVVPRIPRVRAIECPEYVGGSANPSNSHSMSTSIALRFQEAKEMGRPPGTATSHPRGNHERNLHIQYFITFHLIMRRIQYGLG